MQKHSKSYPKRGEIFIADLDPGFGREMRKKRPILVISNNTINKNSNTLIMVPFSSIVPEFMGPNIVDIENEGLDKRSAIIVDQIRSVDKGRLINKVGKLTSYKLFEVEDALKIVLGFESLVLITNIN